MRVPVDWLLKSKRLHREYEDSWYSCPKSVDVDGYSNAGEGDDCTCGADEWNAEIDAMLAAAQQEGKRSEAERIGEFRSNCSTQSSDHPTQQPTDAERLADEIDTFLYERRQTTDIAKARRFLMRAMDSLRAKDKQP